MGSGNKVSASVAGRKLVRDVFLGFIRVHILHHAAREPIFGLEMIEELRRHGYSIGPGTLYPILHGLESAGALRSRLTLVEGKNRRYYRTTRAGDALLAELRSKVREFVDEVLEPAARSKVGASRRRRGKLATSSD
jgi:DNA-binding PadR family transcriptional regulator